MSADEDDAPEVGDIMDFELRDESEKRWLVLFDEDYDDLMLDGEDQVAILVDLEQAKEVLTLASEAVYDLSDVGPDETPIELFIDELQDIAEEAEDGEDA